MTRHALDDGFVSIPLARATELRRHEGERELLIEALRGCSNALSVCHDVGPAELGDCPLCAAARNARDVLARVK